MMHFPDTFPVPLIKIDETDSTSNYLNAICNERRQEEFTTVKADYQTAGRGQRGNIWEAEAGQNLLFSFVVYPAFLEARKQFLLSQIVSLAIKEELETYTTGITIKWPNDIYWKEKKICGMLIENYLSGRYIDRSIAGIGINVNQREFFSPAPNPVSLWQITGKEESPHELLRGITSRIKKYYGKLQSGETEDIGYRYREALFRKNGFHCYSDQGGTFFAKIIRVEDDGRLFLEDESETLRSYLFKEVAFSISD